MSINQKLIVLGLGMVLAAGTLGFDWADTLFRSAEAHDVQEQHLQSRFVRIEDETFNTQSMQTGEILTVQGRLVSLVERDLRAWVSIFSESEDAGDRWEVVGRDPPGVFDIAGNSAVPYTVSARALHEGVYHVHAQLNVAEVGSGLGPGATVVVEGEPIAKPAPPDSAAMPPGGAPDDIPVVQIDPEAEAVALARGYDLRRIANVSGLLPDLVLAGEILACEPRATYISAVYVPHPIDPGLPDHVALVIQLHDPDVVAVPVIRVLEFLLSNSTLDTVQGLTESAEFAEEIGVTGEFDVTHWSTDTLDAAGLGDEAFSYTVGVSAEGQEYHVQNIWFSRDSLLILVSTAGLGEGDAMAVAAELDSRVAQVVQPDAPTATTPICEALDYPDDIPMAAAAPVAGIGPYADLRGADLAGADLRGATLFSADLAGAHLQHANLTGASLQAANLTGAHLQAANLTGAILINADLAGAHLRYSYLPHADLRAANLTGADLTGAHLQGARLHNADLTGANLSGTDLTYHHTVRIWPGTILSGADLYGANLTGASLLNANLSGADLRYATLSNADLRGANLSGANLSYADLTEANLKRAHLQGADLRHANLNRTDITHANLSGADFRDVDPRYAFLYNFKGADLRGAIFSNATLQGAIFSNATLQGAIFSNASLWYAHLPYADLRGADLSHATLQHAYLPYTDLRGADFSGAGLSYTDLQGADFSGANLSYAILNSADITHANLTGTDLRHAELHNADLRHATLSGADLRQAFLSDFVEAGLSGADLSYADLSGADLRGAMLSNADLRGADLTGADLRDADLSVAVIIGAHLQGADLSGAHISDFEYLGMGALSYSHGPGLSGADLWGADLSGANLTGADLSGAHLFAANLTLADLSGADLTAAFISGADLSGADLRGADLSGAAIIETDLSGANLQNSNLTGADLRGADLTGTVGTEDFTGALACDTAPLPGATLLPCP